MKKILFIVFFALMQLPSFAQKEIGYTYDGAGNRIKRELLFVKSKTRAKSEQDRQPDNYMDKLNKQLITISPNPTHGIIRIHIDKYSTEDQYAIYVYTVGGEKVFHSAYVEPTTNIDLSNLSDGIYLLKIANSDKSVTWKIIKQ